MSGEKFTDNRNVWQPISTAPRGPMLIYYQPRDGKRCVGLCYLAKDSNT